MVEYNSYDEAVKAVVEVGKVIGFGVVGVLVLKGIIVNAFIPLLNLL